MQEHSAGPVYQPMLYAIYWMARLAGSDSYLKGKSKSEDTCAPLFKVYQTCVKVSKATKIVFKILRD